MNPYVYGIGNPLIDIQVNVTNEELSSLGLHKGTMHLIDQQRRAELLTFIKDKEITYSCGGSCPNTIITLVSFGVRAAVAGKVGSDEFGRIFRERLSELYVTDELKVCEAPTGSSIILISPDSERTMNTFLGANRLYGIEDVNRQLIAQSDIFHFTGYMWDTESQKSSIMEAVAAAESGKTRISFDIADPFAVSRNRKAFLELIEKHVDIVFANGEESQLLFDHYDARECVKSMGKIAETAVVKNGKHGSFVSFKGEIIEIPVKGKEAVDTTGAGDIYAAGYLLGLSKGYSPYNCGLLASYLAGEIIGKRGAQFDRASISEIAARLEDGSWKR